MILSEISSGNPDTADVLFLVAFIVFCSPSWRACR